MDREIEFRAFIREGDEDIMTYNLAFDEYGIINDQLGSVPTLMQFTGLKDKNGKDIYEGDIVEKLTYPRDVFEVKFTGGAFTIARYIPSQCKVIGNIYQNPELLK
jgi:uncharacterized phage protein (TIGR01671 family)